VYWFFFFKLKQRTYGEDIPTYSTEDKERLFAEHENDDITPNLKFRGILKNMITSALVPLQEYVFRQWYYRRIMTIGDAAHKVGGF
jgi:2-polyprenyl-6-methoxyphenol hydroxylase-like FAD-dependent oxidoreductase